MALVGRFIRGHLGLVSVGAHGRGRADGSLLGHKFPLTTGAGCMIRNCNAFTQIKAEATTPLNPKTPMRVRGECCARGAVANA